MDVLNLAGTLLTIGFGLLGVFMPKKAARLVGLQAKTKAGISEFRATYGGVWLAMGIIALIANEPLVYAVVGLAWLGAALGRVVSILVDRASSRQNWLAVMVELIGALLLLAGAPLTVLTTLA